MQIFKNWPLTSVRDLLSAKGRKNFPYKSTKQNEHFGLQFHQFRKRQHTPTNI